MKYRLLIAFMASTIVAQAQADTTLYGYIDSVTYKKMDIAPTYPGGPSAFNRFLSKNLIYPKTAKKKDIAGTVVVEFTVDRKGYPSDIVIRKSVSPDLDEEALRLIKKSGMWIPGIANGRMAVCRTRQEIEFKLDE